LTLDAVIHRRNIHQVEDVVRLAVGLSAWRVENAQQVGKEKSACSLPPSFGQTP
jgi:hypothetical protein